MLKVRRTIPPKERLHELLSYDPKTGELHWKIWRGNTAKPGSIAGSIRKPHRLGHKPYLWIGVDGIIYTAHRVIWKMMLGTEPPAHLDHHDGDSLNNRWVNLRPADDHLNAANRVHTKSSGGYKGVYKRHGRFRAMIKVNQQAIHLGTYDTAEEAHAAYAAAARMHFGGYHRTH